MTRKSNIKIRLLQQAPEHFAQVAAWHHQECERQGLQSTLAIRQQRLLLHVQQNVLPKTIVALDGDQLVGCVSLVNYSYRTDSSVLIPSNSAAVWLSNLYVTSEQRQRGIGNLLIEAAKKYAADFGANELWLSAAEFTDYYQKRDWEIVRKTRLGGRPVNVMRIALKSLAVIETQPLNKIATA
ncbi:GNAT family N-acetyltransferase [Cellvibrio sp.]|uniref:GNAT family N-acetyltransferase n=1 Tax=Cellvibrio sp. TaxID=1965322 RepID=UPI0039648987